MKTGKIVVVVVGVGVLGLGFSWKLGSNLVAPVNRPVPRPADFPAQEISIPGLAHNVAAWWLEVEPTAPAVVLLPGIRADRRSMVDRARLLFSRGFSVLLIDLQAHGETPGEAISFGLRESVDVRDALAWLHGNTQARRIGAIGYSLGGAAIVLGHQPVGLDAVVLEAVYPRFGRAVENRIRLRLGALAPVLAPVLLAQIEPRLGISLDQLEPIRFIAQVGAPVLIVAGSEDRHTSLVESKEMFRAAVEPKQLWIVSGAGHQDFLSFDPTAYELQVVGFFDQILRPGSFGQMAVRTDGARARESAVGPRKMP